MSRGRGRGGSRENLRRKPPTRDPRPRILVLCEGAKCEPGYLRAFCRHFRATSVVLDKAAGLDPKALVEVARTRLRESRREAKQYRDKNLEFDQVWCVVDVDDHRRLQEARIMARDNGIELVISNPCFELWLILHFRDQTAYIDRFQLKSACRNLSESDRAGYPPFAICVSHYDTAVGRARQLDDRNDRDGEPGRNPSTSVYRLTERILEIVNLST